LVLSSVRRTRSADWGALDRRDHGVQFYTHDHVLIDLLGRYVGPAVVRGDGAVVIATAAHIAALSARLGGLGLDLSVARRQGRYVALEAEDVLRRFMAAGSPDAERFGAVISPIIDRVERGCDSEQPRLAVFGEMVALLWKTGQAEAAIRLEEIWSELAESRAFSLCCAYPMNGFVHDLHAAPFLKICAQHSHVFPAERRSMQRV
jgi:hypothetical protein